MVHLSPPWASPPPRWGQCCPSGCETSVSHKVTNRWNYLYHWESWNPRLKRALASYLKLSFPPCHKSQKKCYKLSGWQGQRWNRSAPCAAAAALHFQPHAENCLGALNHRVLLDASGSTRCTKERGCCWETGVQVPSPTQIQKAFFFQFYWTFIEIIDIYYCVSLRCMTCWF